MTKSRIFPVLAALSMILALAACGSSGGDSAAASGGGDTSAAPAAVTIDDLAYSPADLQVAAGTEVTWTNDDDAPHTVTFDDDAVSSSDEMATGDTFSATFDKPGTYAYLCAIHPDMKAKVTVS